MTLDSKKSSPEREQTDEGLRTERENADRALTEQHNGIEDDADLIVLRARENADAILVAARDKADERLGSSAPRASVIEERVLEDEVVREERAIADESLRDEREANARVLARLLPLERAKTDRYLLTERARSDDALSVRDDFLGIVSHDLRNLLSGIVMSSALLAENAPDNEYGQETLRGIKRIQHYAARMNRLIGDLVDVASIDAGKLDVALAQGDAATLVVDAVETFEAAAAARRLSLEVQLPERPLLAEFDQGRMLQVLANLITNAIKFTAPGGGICVRAERAGDTIELTITDTGAGIPSTMLEAVFERFWQVGKGDRRGVGLGLYISRCIVEAHGGRIWAESKLGEGTTVRFTIPNTVSS